MPEDPPMEKKGESTAPNRRAILASAAMAGGLVAGYGAMAGVAGRFLYPAKPAPKGWLMVSDLDGFKPGASIVYRTPAGAPVAIARRGRSGTADDFIALSSTCPHLGCQVHWEGQNNRFFCPCHNGAFDAEGKATSGPPADAGQSLKAFPLKVEKGLLYIEVPLNPMSRTDGGGKDGCLEGPRPA